MKKILLVTLLAGISLTSCSQQPTAQTRQQANAAPAATEKGEDAKSYQVSVTHATDSANIVRMLQIGSELPADVNVPIFFANQFLGKPYVGYTLDQNNEEKLVINTEGVDCTTFVENVLALSVCAMRKITDFQGFCDVLREVRYIGGKVAYTTRQHYFTTWIQDNLRDSLIVPVKLPAPPYSAKRKSKVNYMTTHVSAYRMLNAHREWLPMIKAMEDSVNHTTIEFIPKQQLKNDQVYRGHVRNGDIIGIVTNKAGLDISHVGLAIWHDDGLHLFNASSIHKKVVDEKMTLYQYLQRQTSSVGIAVVRMKCLSER